MFFVPMGQELFTMEPFETPPPPLPARNPLRDKPSYRQIRHPFRAKLVNRFSRTSSPSSRATFEELDQELKDPQPRLVSTIYDSNKKRSLWQDEGAVKHMLDASTTTTSSYNGDVLSSSSSVYSIEDEEEARVEAWLARGLPLEDTKHTGHVKKDLDHANTAKPRALSPFPPVSPTTGNREYAPLVSPFRRPAHPVSPLKNGRDAYGNYIPSNTRDYFITQSPPISPAPWPLKEDQLKQMQSKQKPDVHMRGGWDGKWPLPWGRSGKEQLEREEQLTGEQRRNSGTSLSPDSRLFNGANNPHRPAGRPVPSVRSQYSTALGTNLTTGNRTYPRPAANNDEHNDTGHRGDYDTNAQRRLQPRPPSSLDERLRDNLSAVFNEYFPIPVSKPIPRHPPTPESALQSHEYPERPTSPQSERTDITTRSGKIAPREWKRWDKDLPPVPPKGLAPQLPEAAKAYKRYHDDEYDDGSVCSEYTGPDLTSFDVSDLKSIDRRILETGVYQDARRRAAEETARNKQREAAQRILEERERNERAASPGSTDIHTVRPEDSLSQVHNDSPPRGTDRRYGILHFNDNESYHVDQRDQPFGYSNKPVQHYPHSSVAPTATPVAPITPVRSGKPNMNSMEMAFHIAGKMGRFLLAAPSDPKFKTYSRRYPPAKDQRPIRINTGESSSVAPLERASDIASPTGERGKEKNKRKDKGKGKAVDMGATTSKRDFAPRILHESTISGTTAVNTTSAYTSGTFANPRAPANPYPPSEASIALTQWPETDELGNVHVPHRKLAMRGGSGGDETCTHVSRFSVASSLETSVRKFKDRKKMQGKKGSPWANREYALAMHSMM